MDILLVQEPWNVHDISRQRTKTHKAFETFSPLSTWHSRPRVMTYVRKDARLKPFQLSSDLSRDLAQIALTLRNNTILPIWNVYNAPVGCEGAGEGLSKLISCTSSPFFVGGDFNLRHPSWDSIATNSRASCEALIDWYESKGLMLLNPTQAPTHNRGGTLDLAFCVDKKASCEVRSDLHTTSDHETLVSSLYLNWKAVRESKLRYKAIDTDLFQKLLGNTHFLPTIASQEEFEIEANDVIVSLHVALTGSCPRHTVKSHGTPWWNDDCWRAAHAYYRARRSGPATWEKFQLQNTVRQAKKSHWNSTVEDSKSLTDVFKIVRWHNAAPRHQSPPLRSDEDSGKAVHDPLSKALLFYRFLLCRHLETSDIPIDTPTMSPRNIPWETISNPEAYTATCQVKSTTPGEDELTTHTLRLAWPAMGDRITILFNHCIKLGVHPSAFKKAVIIILPKTGKRDRSLPKSYRPIALLSCLGKGLERLIARRISYWALKSEILARDQCSAVRQRSVSRIR